MNKKYNKYKMKWTKLSRLRKCPTEKRKDFFIVESMKMEK